MKECSRYPCRLKERWKNFCVFTADPLSLQSSPPGLIVSFPNSENPQYGGAAEGEQSIPDNQDSNYCHSLCQPAWSPFVCLTYIWPFTHSLHLHPPTRDCQETGRVLNFLFPRTPTVLSAITYQIVIFSLCAFMDPLTLSQSLNSFRYWCQQFSFNVRRMGR